MRPRGPSARGASGVSKKDDLIIRVHRCSSVAHTTAYLAALARCTARSPKRSRRRSTLSARRSRHAVRGESGSASWPPCASSMSRGRAPAPAAPGVRAAPCGRGGCARWRTATRPRRRAAPACGGARSGACRGTRSRRAPAAPLRPAAQLPGRLLRGRAQGRAERGLLLGCRLEVRLTGDGFAGRDRVQPVLARRLREILPVRDLPEPAPLLPEPPRATASAGSAATSRARARPISREPARPLRSHTGECGDGECPTNSVTCSGSTSRTSPGRMVCAASRAISRFGPRPTEASAPVSAAGDSEAPGRPPAAPRGAAGRR